MQKCTFTCDNNLFILTGALTTNLPWLDIFFMVTYYYLSHDAVICNVDYDLFLK